MRKLQNYGVIKGTMLNEVEIVETGEVKYGRIAIAINDPKSEKESDKFYLTAFNGTSKLIKENCKPGAYVEFMYQLKPNNYEIDGKKIYNYQLIVKEFEILRFAKNKENAEDFNLGENVSVDKKEEVKKTTTNKSTKKSK